MSLGVNSVPCNDGNVYTEKCFELFRNHKHVSVVSNGRGSMVENVNYGSDRICKM